MKIKKSKTSVLFYILGYAYIVFFTVYCVLPFLLLISGSFTEEKSIYHYGYRLIPKVFSLEAYKAVFEEPVKILMAYGVTVSVTIIGTLFSLFFTSMTGYVLQRKDFKYRNKFSFYFYFTTLFSGGLIPWYILIVKYLQLKNHFVVLILPYVMTPFLIILMKNFMKSVPDSISESAKLDGAGDFTIYRRLILPLVKPGLATVGLFVALIYWNDWFLASIFITKEKMFPLQYLLYKTLQQAQFITSNTSESASQMVIETPQESYKLAISVVVTGPIIFLYPFIQKYFIKGLTIGAVKG